MTATPRTASPRCSHRRQRGLDGWYIASYIYGVMSSQASYLHSGRSRSAHGRGGEQAGRGLGGMPGGGRVRKVRRDTTSRYGPGALAAMEAALREDRGMAEDAVT